MKFKFYWFYADMVSMKNLSQALRHKRFALTDQADVQFLIETKTGARIPLKLNNVSLTGIGAFTAEPLGEGNGLDIGEIIPAAKITWENHDYSLGRLVLRTILKSNNVTHLGFSTIDSKVPVDGSLSRFLKDAATERGSPYDFELSPDKFNLSSFAHSNHSNVDLFQRCKQFEIFFKDWKKSPKFLYHTVRTPSKGTRVNLEITRKNGRHDFLVMGSNDYLGLATHPEVLQAAKGAIDVYGFGSTGSPVTTGLTSIHDELCEELSRTLKKEKTILFNSGYAANVGTIPALTAAQDLIVADILSHASLQDGIRMSQATARFYKHNSTEHLQKILREMRKSHTGALVVTEGVFSMDGDAPPLEAIIKICKEHNCRLLLDEAHSFGVIGDRGLGLADKCNQLANVDILMGTFSKICGGIGGFISTSEEVADWLAFYGRSHMFSVSIPPSTAAAALQALRIFKSEKHLLSNLKTNIRHFVTGLRNLGCNIPENHESAVIPVVIGDEEKLGAMNQVLLDNGVFVIPIVYPAVSRNNSRFRFTVMATHSLSDLDYVLNILELAMAKANFTFKDQRGAE